MRLEKRWTHGRAYYVHRGRPHALEPRTWLMALHGLGHAVASRWWPRAYHFPTMCGLGEEADERGWGLAFPAAAFTNWDGFFGDDARYLSNVLASLHAGGAARVIALGFSDGGIMLNTWMQQPQPIAGLGLFSAQIPSANWAPHLPAGCRMPVAVVHGRKDGPKVRSDAAKAAETYRAAGCRVLPFIHPAGHVWPRELNGPVLDFLAGITNGAARHA